jgi:FkbM family methyltransferase
MRIRQITIRLIQVAIFLIPGVTVLSLFPSNHRLMRGLLDVIAGRTECTIGQIWKGEKYLSRKLESLERIRTRVLKIGETETLNRWQTPNGVYWAPKRMSVNSFSELLAEQENGLYGTETVRSGDVVIDCGANIGTFTTTALRAGAKLVVAVEPAADLAEALRRTFEPEIRAGRVHVCQKGVWDKDDILVLRKSGGAMDDSFVLDPSEGRPNISRIPLTTIDNLVSEMNLPQVDVIKMDIEGAERRALSGATKTIQKYRPRLVVATEHLLDDPRVIPELVKQLWRGYVASCGPCYQMFLHGRVAPDVMYFRD